MANKTNNKLITIKRRKYCHIAIGFFDDVDDDDEENKY